MLTTQNYRITILNLIEINDFGNKKLNNAQQKKYQIRFVESYFYQEKNEKNTNEKIAERFQGSLRKKALLVYFERRGRRWFRILTSQFYYLRLKFNQKTKR